MPVIHNKSIVIDCRMIEKSGVGSYIKNLLPKVCSSFNNTALLGDIKKLAPYKLKYANISLIDFTAPIYSIAEQIGFVKKIPPCDIFWSPHYNVPLLPIKAKKRLVTIHDVHHLFFFKTLSLKQKIYAKLVMNKAVNASQKIITVSNYSEKEIVKYTKCDADKIIVIYNGVNKVLDRNASTFKEIKEKYNIPDNYLLYVGNVKPHKNLSRLITAYLELDTELTNQYKLVIAGKVDGFITSDKNVFELIKKNLTAQKNIIFTGFIEDTDMDSIYKNAALFVFPSIYEGFGLPPLEAMANSCAVVASKTSCIPEICGNAAIYFDPFKEIEICDKITTILTDKTKANDLINKGIDRIKLFEWEAAADKHINLINNLLD